jgi:beta-glucosidase
MINGGVDMLMVSKKANAERIFKHAKRYTEHNYIPESRLTDAVTRILTVKMAMGLIEKVQLDEEAPIQKVVDETIKYPSLSSGNEYQDSLSAVQESLVLLKNTNTLPARGLLSSIKYVVLIGEKIHNINRLTRIQLFRNFDNIGMQCGGWSVRWQGVEGNEFWTGALKDKSNASSILDALKKLQSVNNFELIYPNYTNLNNELTIEQERTKFINDLKVKRKDLNSRNTLIIGTFGEFPYAEGDGDVNIPYCKLEDNDGCKYNPTTNPYAPGSQLRTLKVDFAKFDSEVLSTIREQDKNIPLVSVLLSGRPMLIDDLITNSNAVLAAWLPGTSGGQGIVDAIVGNYVIKPSSASTRNTLSMDWPADMVLFILFRHLWRISLFTALTAQSPRLTTLSSPQAMASPPQAMPSSCHNDPFALN